MTRIAGALRALPLRKAFCTAALVLPLMGCSTLHSIGHVFDSDATPAEAAPAKAATAARPGKDFYTGKYSFVRIEASEGGARSALPLTVDADRLSASLAELRGNGGDFAGKPLFSKDELAELVPALHDALAQAQAGQDVVFAITGKHSSVPLFESESVTTGRVFVADGRLQLIFGMTRVNFGDELRGNHTLKTFVPGSRAQLRASASPVTGTGWQINSGARPDWLSIDPATLNAAAASVPAATAPAPQPAPGSQAAPAPNGVGMQPAAPAPAVAGVPPVPESSPGEAAERRLATLERLHKKGLISDQEYQQKHQSVLDGL